MQEQHVTDDEAHFDVPVVLIIYRRPELTSSVLDVLDTIRPSQLFVIADGPKTSEESDKVQLTRALFEDLAWSCSLIKIYADQNMGLKERVVSGLNQVFSLVDRAIILEDDCIPSSSFFRFSQELLERYAGQGEIGFVSGNNFSLSKKYQESYHFSYGSNIWGWATWRRTWTAFVNSGILEGSFSNLDKQSLKLLPDRRSRKQLLGLMNKHSKLDSWATSFAVFLLRSRLLSVVPSRNLVSNSGFGIDSTHTKFESWAHHISAETLAFPLIHPKTIVPNYAQAKREARSMRLRWLRFPIVHPIESIRRLVRFVLQSRS